MQQPNAQLDPPKDTPISKEELSKYDGTQEGYGIYVAIKGTVFDGEFPRGLRLVLSSRSKTDDLVVPQCRPSETCMDPDVATL